MCIFGAHGRIGVYLPLYCGVNGFMQLRINRKWPTLEVGSSFTINRISVWCEIKQPLTTKVRTPCIPNHNIASLDGGLLILQITAPGTGWVGIGFSPSGTMKGADIVFAWMMNEEPQALV